MRREHLSYLRCPKTGRPLQFKSEVEVDSSITSGSLLEPISGNVYPIIRGIPRFVPADNYANNFGFEWSTHAQTQHDGFSRQNLSERRFREETRWGNDLGGKVVLEAGCGSGRFTHYPLADGAMVIAFDYSTAIEVANAHHGKNPRFLAVQADITKPPFNQDAFDYIFCLGVLQHTPDPRASFLRLTKLLKPGGSIACDVYVFDLLHAVLHTKYYVRPVIKYISPERLYGMVKCYISFLWPLIRVIRRIPWRIGQGICWRLLVADFYSAMPGAPDRILKEWAYLDTFDMLSPKYDKPQRRSVFTRWFEEAGLENIDVHPGWNGLEGRGRKPLMPRSP